ncbi:hypothetical protein [Nocardioides sp.]|uniref:hypothetical protein n=1 Tax=Nocardioides sp. TaxID=35761 RepID=UPI0035160EA6
MRPRSLPVSILTTLATAAALTAGPLADAGHAAPTTTISQVATPAPGHVTGTVTSDAAFIRVSLVSDQGTLADDVRAVPPESLTVTFDLPTWGFPDATAVQVATCSGPSSCGGVADSQSFTPIDLTPTVTWPSDSTIGPSDGPIVVTVADPDGGGGLRVIERKPDGDQFVANLPRDEATPLYFYDGVHDLRVQRCARGNSPCRSYPDLDTRIEVRRYLYAYIGQVASSVIAPDDTSAPDIEVPISVGSGSNLTARLRVHSATTDREVRGFGATVVGLTRDSAGMVVVPIDLTGIRSGTYDIRGTVEYDDPDFGHVSGEINASWPFTVDADAPVISSVGVSSTTVFPVPDGYRDQIDISAEGYDHSPATIIYEIRNAAGTLVRTLGPASFYASNLQIWDGRDDRGRIVTAGAYTVTITATDSLGHARTAPPLTITVSTKRLVQRTFTRTVTAKESLVAKSVGRCSTLKMPSARGWRGSMGLYTGTRCKGSIKATLVSTAHALRVPAALRYGSIRVTAYGGAAKAEPRSLAYLTYLHPKDGWGADTQMSTRLGDHAGTTVRAGDYLFKDGTFEWGAYTADGARYDIKNFTVRMTYSVLQ